MTTIWPGPGLGEIRRLANKKSDNSFPQYFFCNYSQPTAHPPRLYPHTSKISLVSQKNFESKVRNTPKQKSAVHITEIELKWSALTEMRNRNSKGPTGKV